VLAMENEKKDIPMTAEPGADMHYPLCSVPEIVGQRTETVSLHEHFLRASLGSRSFKFFLFARFASDTKGKDSH